MGLVKITQNPNETALKLAVFQNGGECAVCAYLLQYDVRLLLHDTVIGIGTIAFEWLFIIT